MPYPRAMTKLAETSTQISGGNCGRDPAPVAVSESLTPRRSPDCPRRTDQIARLGLHLRQMLGAHEGFGVDLVDVLGAGRVELRTRRSRSSTFSPPIAAPLPGAVVSVGGDRLAGQLGRGDADRATAWPVPPSLARWPARRSARTPGSPSAASARRSSSRRGPAGHRGDLGGEQGQDDAVLVGGPHACRRCAGTTRPRSPRRRTPSEPSSKPGHEPLEADRHLEHLPAEAGDDPVDHRGRCTSGLADLDAPRPARRGARTR